MILLAGVGLVSWRSNQLRERSIQLERVVHLRTTELADAKRDLEERVRQRTIDLEASNQQLQWEIEHRRQAESKLLESEFRYRTIVEAQSELIVRFARDGAIQFANSAFCRQCDEHLASLLGSSVFAYMDSALPSLLESYRHAKQGSATKGFRQRLLRGKELVWEEWTLGKIENATGELVAFQAVGRDITTLVETQEALRQKEDYLRHASRLSLLGEMVASITHELRQPLGSISNFAFAAGKSLAGDESKSGRQLAHWNQQIVEQIARADTIVRRLRGFARRADSELENCDISQVVSDTLSMMEFELLRSKVAVETDLAKDLQPIHISRVQVEQVLVNLIRNGCDAMESVDLKNRKISIKTQREGNGVLVQVNDNGVVFPKIFLGSCFSPFFRPSRRGLGWD